MATILFVDEDTGQRRKMALLAAGLGHNVLEAVSVNDARGLLNSRTDAARNIDLLIIDAAMAKTAHFALGNIAPLVIISVPPDKLGQVAEMMQAGAVDFLLKPVRAERLQVSIINALRLQALMHDARRAQTLALRPPEPSDLVAGDPAMVRALSVATRAARSDVPVLIEGEAGTGRESVARLIHANGAGGDERRARPFVVLRCQLMTPASLEQGVFANHVREAHSGTLYLDDVDALPPSLQERLMHLVSEADERDRSRRGSRTEMRVIAAARSSLLNQVRAGIFREDLFYRFNVLPITLPPLRARRSDIATLVQLFVARFAAVEGKVIETITPEALSMLSNYTWPGNVAELENAVFRAVVLAEGACLGVDEFPQITTRLARRNEYGANYARPLPLFPQGSGIAPATMIGLTASAHKSTPPVILGQVPDIASGQTADPFAMALVDNSGEVRPLEELEADAIQFAIRHYQGRMSEVSRRLGIGRSTLYRKVKDFCFDSTEQDRDDVNIERLDLKINAELAQARSQNV